MLNGAFCIKVIQMNKITLCARNQMTSVIKLAAPNRQNLIYLCEFQDEKRSFKVIVNIVYAIFDSFIGLVIEISY